MLKVCEKCGQEYESYLVCCPECVYGRGGKVYFMGIFRGYRLTDKLTKQEILHAVKHIVIATAIVLLLVYWMSL